jgi:hypothetical protein
VKEDRKKANATMRRLEEDREQLIKDVKHLE